MLTNKFLKFVYRYENLRKKNTIELMIQVFVANEVSSQIEPEGQNQALPDRPLWKRLKHCTHIPTSGQNIKIIFSQQMSMIKTLKVSNSIHWMVSSSGTESECRDVVPASTSCTGSSLLRWQRAEQWPLACKVLDQSPISGARGTEHWDFIPTSPQQPPSIICIWGIRDKIPY